jgi:DNA-binding transcriptional regulator YhcF (GntR family)
MQQKALNNLKKKLEQDDTRAAIIQEKSMLKKIKLLKWVIKKCFDVFVPYKDLLVVLKQYYPDDFKNLSVSVLSSYITQNFHYEDKRNIEVTGQNETQQKALNNLKKKLEQKNTRVTLSQAQKMLKKIKLFRDAIIECRNAYVPHKDTLAVLKQYYPNDFKNLNAQTLSAYTSQHLYDNDRGNEEVTGENKAQQAALDNLKKKLEQDDTRAAITQEKGMLKKIKLLKEVINECYAVHVSHKDVFTILKKYYPDDFKNLSTQTLSNYINQHLL